MPLKIDTNHSATAFHLFDGATVFPYAVDAHSAISRHPFEWKDSPWTQEQADAARKELVAQREREISAAKARGIVPPPPLDFGEPAELAPEEQEAIDAHAKAVAEAQERLDQFRADQAEKKKIADQVAADEALVASAPPRPDPTIRRPFGRKGEPTPAEIEQANKRAAKKADDDRIAKEKADADAGRI